MCASFTVYVLCMFPTACAPYVVLTFCALGCFLQSLHMTVSKVSALYEFLTDIFILHLKQSVHYLHHLQSMHYLSLFQAVHYVYLIQTVHYVRPQHDMHFVHLSRSVFFVRFLQSMHYMCF